MMFLKEAAGNKFAKKNAARIDAAPKKGVPTFQQAADGGEKTCCAIDRKHPDGGVSHKFIILIADRMQACVNDFHAPSGESACEK